MEEPPRLVQWDHLKVRLDGEKLTELVRAEIARGPQPVESFDLVFEEGRVVIDAVIRKVVAIPVRVECRTIEVRGHAVVAHLSTVGVFGVPLPKILAWFAPERLREGVRLDPGGPSVIIDARAFMPPFVDTSIAGIRMIRGGVEIELGSGGADFVPEREG